MKVVRAIGRAVPGVAVLVVPVLAAQVAHARGPSPYLPLNLSPRIERQIERVLILAGKPVMRKPIAAAVVLDALPSACQVDQALCDEVRTYLNAYTRGYAVTNLAPHVSLSSGDSTATLPNQHGESVDSAWRFVASGYYQPNDYVILNAGGVAYDGNATATGSFVSAGFDWAQLDIGFRDHWFSPLSDSSSLISTEARTMPSITVSNYVPLPLGLNYELFVAEMSRQDGIRIFDSTTSGKPRLTGTQLGIEPVTGYSLVLNRVVQYGGGVRTKGLSQIVDSILNNSNSPDTQGAAEEFGNQVVSITSSFLVPGKVPFAINMEYAGEDNAYSKSFRLGATNMSVGIDLPRLWKRFDAKIEASEWQNSWYVHHLYPLGLTNHGNVLGHWFGDQRQFGNAIGGDSQMLAVGWQRTSDQYLRLTYRTMALDPRWDRNGGVPDYERLQSLGVSLSTQWRGYPVEVELSGGQDIFGESFGRLSGSVDFSGSSLAESVEAVIDDAVGSADVELFVDSGANRSKVLKLLQIGVPADPAARGSGAHLGVGVRRAVSKRVDLGARVELDQVDGNQLLSLRALDYRYRVTRRIAVNGFFGYGRYDFGLPAYGYYWGAGLQLRDVLPKWDIGFDVRHYEKLNRDKSLPTDPVPTAATHPRLYIDIDGTSLYVSRRW